MKVEYKSMFLGVALGAVGIIAILFLIGDFETEFSVTTGEHSNKMDKNIDVRIQKTIENDEFIIEDTFEDVHSKIEFELTRIIGETGKKIHTARSRNDQVLVDLHLYVKDEISTSVYNWGEMLYKLFIGFGGKGLTDEEVEVIVNDYIKEGYEQSIFPFDRSLVSSTELFHWLQDETKIRITREREVTAALELLNPKPIRKKGCPVREVGHNINVWIIRDHEKYKNLTSIELGMKYQGFYTDNRVEKVKNKSYDKYRNTGKGPLMPYKDLTEGSTRNVTKEGEVDVAQNLRDQHARIGTKLILKKNKTF